MEIVKDCLEKVNKAIRLREVDSKLDPPKEPFRSKYAARDLFNDIKNVLSPDAFENEEEKALVFSILAYVEYYIGLIASETEELPVAEKRLKKCLLMLEGKKISQRHILACLLAHNELGVLWSMRGDNKKAAEYLKTAVQLSQKYRSDVEMPPYSIKDLFHILLKEEPDKDTNTWKLFEDAITYCIYYLAQAFTCIEEPAKAAVCYEITLRRQLDRQEFDGVDWAVNAATLSQFFISEKNFQAARHLLACATKILDSCEKEKDETDDTIKRRKADIARCWGKYGNLLLTFSWNNLLNLAEDMKDIDLNGTEKGEGYLEKQKEVDVGFNVLELGGRDPHRMFELLEVSDIEKQITADKVLDFSQARLIFLNAQKWLNEAKEYYTLGEHASDNLQLTQEMSQLYKILAYFEPQADRRCKMHKRRIDLLQAGLNSVNPKYYLDYVRQLQFEIAETYSEIMDIKMGMVSEGEQRLTPHAALKIQSLVNKAILNFKQFVDSFMSKGELPEELSEDCVRPMLLAHVFLGRLHSKRNPDLSLSRVEHLNESLKNYKYVVDYCEKYPDACDAIEQELSVTKEMVTLLPKKIDKIMSECT